MIKGFYAPLILAMLSLFISPFGLANSIDELIATKQLRINIKRQPEDSIIAKQAVTIQVEIATNRWFEGANIIEDIKLENLVSLPQSDSGINGTIQIDGETWASQIKELTVFPMVAGVYQVPPLQVTMSVNTETGIVSGTTTTEPLIFEVHLPEELTIYPQYWVSKSFSIDAQLQFDDVKAGNVETEVSVDDEVEIERIKRKEFEIGQAVTQTITFTIENIPAMMLPELESPQISGISIYHKPSQVFDKTNRGSLIGTRVEQFTYIFEEPGNYTTSEQLFIWWDTNNQSIQKLIIPSQQWQVTAPISYYVKNIFKSPQHWLSLTGIGYVIGALMSLVLLRLVYNARMTINRQFKRWTKHQFRQHSAVFLKLVRDKKYQQACFYLYRIVDIKKPEINTLKAFFADHKVASELFNELFLAGFATRSIQPVTSFNEVKAKRLVNIIEKLNKNKKNRQIINIPSPLNPQ